MRHTNIQDTSTQSVAVSRKGAKQANLRSLVYKAMKMNRATKA